MKWKNVANLIPTVSDNVRHSVERMVEKHSREVNASTEKREPSDLFLEGGVRDVPESPLSSGFFTFHDADKYGTLLQDPEAKPRVGDTELRGTAAGSAGRSKKAVRFSVEVDDSKSDGFNRCRKVSLFSYLYIKSTNNGK